MSKFIQFTINCIQYHKTGNNLSKYLPGEVIILRKRWVWLVLAIAGLTMGIYYNLGTDSRQVARKPVTYTVESKVIDNANIVMEKEYMRCGHTIISDWDNKEDLAGKTLDEVKSLYSPREGFRVSLKNNVLTIHATVDDWCPRDKQRCRLKEYQGMLAVYQGPDLDNDFLLRVTSIKINSLPEAVQSSVRQHKYEFETPEALNDALENLDEYL